MDYSSYSYDDPYTRRRPARVNYFAWSIAILLLTAFALAAWLGSFYIFGQPERPDSYRILQRLHKIDPPKRFELTAAPAGEFLSAKQLYDRYAAMGSAELAKTNAELARNYIRNYGQVRGLVPYVIGRYMIMEARELGPGDVFTSGMVALTSAVDHGELLMEHLYPADSSVIPLMKQTLKPGLEIKLERTHDLSAVLHAERLKDGRMLITAMPLLYGTYTMTRGPGVFRLEPPSNLNLVAGWPLFKEQARLKAELHFKNYRQEMGLAQASVPISGISPGGTPPPAENSLVRVEPARPVETPSIVRVPKKETKVAETTPTPEEKSSKKRKGRSGSQDEFVLPVAKALPVTASVTPIAVPTTTPTAVAMAETPSPTATPVPVLPAQPAPTVPGEELASTAGGGTWRTFAPGRMPLGRLIDTSDLRDFADRGVAGERLYLSGQFVVNFSDANRAVLRPRQGLADSVLHFGSSTRIIVDFPAGYTPPRQGAVVNRDQRRPYEITEIRKQDDGQLNVFVREIMQP